MIRAVHPHESGVTYGEVPRLWPGCTMVLLGDGPSLTQGDVDFVRNKARVMAMNHNLTMAPWADALWSYHTRGLIDKTLPEVPSFNGFVMSAEPVPAPWPIVRMSGTEGLDLDPSGIRHGNGSGYSAMNVAYHLGARTIILLGYDCCDSADGKFCHSKPASSLDRRAYNYGLWIERFKSIAAPLAAAGVEVLNATRRTALDMFVRIRLEDVFGQEFKRAC